MIANPSQAQSKVELRRFFREQRSKVSADEKAKAASLIVRHFFRMRSGISWLFYAPLEEEISTRLIFDYAKGRHDKVFFPRVTGSALQFRSVEEWSQLKQGALTMEPPSYATEWDSSRPSIIIVPGVAFDRTGLRLGMGQGFYDRFLAEHRRFPRLAIAFDCQIADSGMWQAESHDQPMDYILTPRSVWGSPRVLI